MLTKTSASYSHSNNSISFPSAAFINYAFLLEGLYFLRQELECMLNFLLSTRAAPSTASPLQLLPRQLIEKCSLAWRILMYSYLCTHITYSHTGNACVCVCVSMCTCMHVIAPCVMNYSRCVSTWNSVLLSLALYSAYLYY